MGKIIDLNSHKQTSKKSDPSKLKFGDEVMMTSNEYWRGMVIEEKRDGVVVMKYGLTNEKPWIGFIFTSKEMLTKTGVSFTNKARFIKWFAEEVDHNVLNNK